MASKITVTLTDDIDGTPAESTVSFAYAGTAYEIDLNSKHLEGLEKALAPFIEAGRKAGRAGTPARSTRAKSDVDPKAVRAWATSNGIEISARGRIPADIVEKYKAEGN